MDIIMNKVMVYIIIILCFICAILGISLDKANDKIRIFEAEKLASKIRYETERKSYENAIISIKDFYESQKNDINDFKENKNETKCEAVNRLLNRYGN